MNSSEDFSKRALARAVFPHQSVATAALHVKAHPFQGDCSREALADVMEANSRNGVFGVQKNKMKMDAYGLGGGDGNPGFAAASNVSAGTAIRLPVE